MNDDRPEIDPRVGELLRRTEVAPLGMATRVEVGLTRRAREAERLTSGERICIVSLCAAIGTVGGPVTTLIGLLMGVAYTHFTILVEAERPSV